MSKNKAYTCVRASCHVFCRRHDTLASHEHRRCIGCLIFTGHVLPKSLMISGSFAKRPAIWGSGSSAWSAEGAHVTSHIWTYDLYLVYQMRHDLLWVMSQKESLTNDALTFLFFQSPEACLTNGWGMSNEWHSQKRSHVARITAKQLMNESCHAYEWVMSHIWMSHVPRMNESCRAFAWVMSHIWTYESSLVYRMAKTHRMPSLYESFCAKEPYT